MSRIILITEMYQPTDKLGYLKGKKELYVSHGICEETLNNVILPFEPLTFFRDKIYDKNINEWVLEDKVNG